MRRALALVVFLLILVGCSRNVPVVPSANVAKSGSIKFCIFGEAKHHGKKVPGEFCTADYSFCKQAAKLAKKYGGYGNLTKVTECLVVEGAVAER